MLLAIRICLTSFIIIIKNINKKFINLRFGLILLGILFIVGIGWRFICPNNFNSIISSDEKRAVNFTVVKDTSSNNYKHCDGTQDCAKPMYTTEGRRIFITLGTRTTGGYSASVTKVEATGGKFKVYVDETTPGKGCIVTQSITSSITAIELAEDINKPVELVTSLKSFPACK